MTNKFNNWKRIEDVLAYVKLSANAFAIRIGLMRSESIYHIKRGTFGISNDLVDRIVSLYPTINPTWLLSGVGDMLRGTKGNGRSVPFYEEDIADVLRDKKITQTPLGRVRLPYDCDCDMAVRALSRAMLMPGTAAVDLFIKRISADDMVQGNEYVIVTEREVLWRKIRSIKESPDQWRLVAINREEYPDVIINKSDIKTIWRVISRMSILVS